eukprot:TRINITY_DN5147_c0_g4_i5.p1 TRINITY_DN5147_c0_g4~~TRINITY_DN5147_c0_g4_i5.p1  ORF type:complete len:297 (-),score=36.39 TRINITY_DN5147_c0_g4_i5:656-1501(-)
MDTFGPKNLLIKVQDHTPTKPLRYSLELPCTTTFKQLWKELCKPLKFLQKRPYKPTWFLIRILSHPCNHNKSGLCTGSCTKCHSPGENYHQEFSRTTVTPNLPLDTQVHKDHNSVVDNSLVRHGERESNCIVVFVTRAPEHMSNWEQFEDPLESNSIRMAQSWNDKITPHISKPYEERRDKRRRHAVEDFCAFAQHGQTDRIAKWLKFGTLSESDVSVRNSAGMTALYVASLYGNLEVVLKLLEVEHIEISTVQADHNRTPLHGNGLFPLHVQLSSYYLHI